jgi:hypothetical protein
LIVEINAKKFVDWLLGIPTKKLMKPVRAAEVVSVSRRLAELASSNMERNFLWELTADVWRLLIRVPEGKVAANEECVRFLEDFRPFFPKHDWPKVLDVLKTTGDVQVPRFSRNPKVEYRIEKPTLHVPAYTGGPRMRRKQPTDDISERISVAVDAMTEAHCTRPLAVVAVALRDSGLLPKEYSTVQHVRSRNKTRSDRVPLAQQEVPIWLMSYWHSLNPEYALKTVADPEWPKKFVFRKCDC